MTPSRDPETLAERVIQTLMLIVFWSAFGCLGAGLALWVVNQRNDWAGVLLPSGLLSLMLLPALRLIAAIGASYRARDWMTFTSSVAVLAILFALTLRDALALVR